MRKLGEIGQIAAGLSFIVGGYGFQKALVVLERIPYVSDTGVIPHVFGGPLIPSMVVIAIFMLLTARISTRKLVFAALFIGMGSQLAECMLLFLSTLFPYPQPAFEAMYNFLFPITATTSVLPWVYLLSRINPLSAALGNALCILVSAAVVFSTEGNDPPKSSVVILILLGLSMFFFFRSDADIPLQEGTARWVVPYKAVAFVAAYSFAYGISTVTFSPNSMRYAVVLPALLVIFLIIFNSKRFTLFALCRIAFPLVIGGFFLVSFIPGLPEFAFSLVLDSGDACLSMMVLLMACTISYSTKSSPIWIFGLFYLFQFAFQLIGAATGLFVKGIGGFWYTAIIMFATVIVVATTFMISSEKNLFTFWEHSLITNANQEASEAELVELKVRCLGVSYGFTDREVEIVKLAAEGLTNAQIAKNSFISEGTVKVHLHHVYQKMGIHTRKELLQMVQDQKNEVKDPETATIKQA